MSDAKTIRSEIEKSRAESNAAIKAHDDFKVCALLDRDVIVITGAGIPLLERKNVRAAFQQQFRTSADLVYTRNPKKIEVNAELNEAAEHGEWVGSWTVAGQKTETGGTYMALWHPVADKWLIKAEMFFTAK